MKKQLMALAIAAAVPFVSHSEVTIGVIVGATGPAASLGIPYKNAFEIMPDTLGGQPVKYIILDDASDTTQANRLARKLVQDEKVDLIIGSGTVPTGIAVSEVAAESKTPQICL